MPRNHTNDGVFFGKSEVRIGTRLHYYGAVYPNSVWIVNSIYTWKRDGYPPNMVRSPVKMKDVVYLTLANKKGSPAIERRITFSSLRYSAIWRL